MPMPAQPPSHVESQIAIAPACTQTPDQSAMHSHPLPQTEELLLHPRLVASPLESESVLQRDGFTPHATPLPNQSHSNITSIDSSMSTPFAAVPIHATPSTHHHASTSSAVYSGIAQPQSLHTALHALSVNQSTHTGPPNSASISQAVSPAAALNVSMHNQSTMRQPPNQPAAHMPPMHHAATESHLHTLNSRTAAATSSTAGATPHASTQPGSRPSPRKCIIGVCAMDKKSRSAPMKAILERLRGDDTEFEIVIFGDALICDPSIPVTQWPIVDCLIAFCSRGFPLSKCIDYVRLRRPFCINDIPSQRALLSRPAVYEALVAHGLPTPRHMYVHRPCRSSLQSALAQVAATMHKQIEQQKLVSNSSAAGTPRLQARQNAPNANNQMHSVNHRSSSQPDMLNAQPQSTQQSNQPAFSPQLVGMGSIRTSSLSTATAVSATGDPSSGRLMPQPSPPLPALSTPAVSPHPAVSAAGTESLRTLSANNLVAESYLASAMALATSALAVAAQPPADGLPINSPALNGKEASDKKEAINSSQTQPATQSSMTSAAAAAALNSTSTIIQLALQPPAQQTVVEDFDDYILINGQRMNKPLLEKPFDGDDHSISIYYPSSKAPGGHNGGVRHLFRKVQNVSSRFEPIAPPLRSLQPEHAYDSYVYEELLANGQDLKVYTLGPGRSHGEMRKSPVVDGIVERDATTRNSDCRRNSPNQNRLLHRRFAGSFGELTAHSIVALVSFAAVDCMLTFVSVA